MRRWAELRLDAGAEEMGVRGVLLPLFTADGLFDVELKEKDRQTQVERAVQSKA